MSEPALTATERDDLDTAMLGDGWTGLAPETLRVFERILAIRLAEALAAVKRACDIECQSPGTHSGCAHHEPYRVLVSHLVAETTPVDGPQDLREAIRATTQRAIDGAYGTDPRHGLLANAVADEVAYGKRIPLSLSRHFGRDLIQTEETS
jgi:hypothetical protein